MNKTPISILHEFGMKDGSLPIYNLISAKIVNNLNVFKVEVKYKNLIAIGEALNKKEAKQIAAQNMILMIKESQSNYAVTPILPSNKEKYNDNLKCDITNINAKIEEAVNYIGKLQEYCVLNKLVQPEYSVTETSSVPLLIKFTVTCKLGAIIQDATSNTKKQAKQMAAKQMLDRLFNSNALVIAEKYEKKENIDTNLEQKIDEKNEDVLNKLGVRLLELNMPSKDVEETYRQITKKFVRKDLCNNDLMKIQNYHLHIKNVIRNMISNNDDDNLTTICDNIKKYKTILTNITNNNNNCIEPEVLDNILIYIKETLKMDIEKRAIVCYDPLLKAIAYKIKYPVSITQFGASNSLQIANAMALHNILDTIMIYLK